MTTINILGQDYTISMDEELEGMDGYCDKTVKKIKVCSTLKEPKVKTYELEDKAVYLKHVLRHEIVHAFAFESGLDHGTVVQNELVVDWIASMYPKLKKVFDKLKIEN